MALVCCDNIKSDDVETKPPENEEDLEDGEIEDDDEDEIVDETNTQQNVNEINTISQPTTPTSSSKQTTSTNDSEKSHSEKKDRDRSTRDRSREKRDRRHRDKETRHMTEAERSILHLRRKERMEREKWNKYRKEQVVETQDDFAINLEKTLASILKKDRTTTSDEDDERRSSKRKKRDRDNGEPPPKSKKTKNNESPRIEEPDDAELLNVRGGSPDKDERLRISPRNTDESEYSSDHSSRHEDKSTPSSRSRRESKRERRKTNKNKNKARDRNFKRDRSREKKQAAEPVADSKGICIFYLNGKCNKNDCIYSHEAVPPMKLELCKFYLMDCCAKGENCSYMHSDFPCKFYHMGLTCTEGDNCKFAHGKPLTDGLKQILFKHIETAPRDILGGFPRLSREETLNMMDTTQKNLITMYQERKPNNENEQKSTDDKSGTSDGAIPCLFDLDVPVPTELKDVQTTENKTKSGRNRKSRWQEADPTESITNLNLSFTPFNFTQDQDMRITSNGDIDMRTLPPHPMNSLPQPLMTSLPLTTDSSKSDINHSSTSISDTDIRMNIGTNSINFTNDVDIRFGGQNVQPQQQPEQTTFPSGYQDVDIRHLNPLNPPDDASGTTSSTTLNIPSNLPKVQRELFMRIQSQQRENPIQDDTKNNEDDNDVQDTNWYSDDDDDDDENRLTIKVDNEETIVKEKDNEDTDGDNELPTTTPSYDPPVINKPVDIGDISKINITADITKLLSTLSASIVPSITEIDKPKDPRTVSETKNSDPRLDPRRVSTTETSTTSDKLSIYEQGGLDLEDIDFSGVTDEIASTTTTTGRSDVDLRTLGLPFKGMQNYTPATEIDASVSSHAPMIWKVVIVDIPRPDYSGLKLSISDAEKTGDPRLRKIFRLSVEEKDTPASPKESPRSSGTVRVDPRLKKVEDVVKNTQMSPFDTPIMNYTQQLNTLQSSAFYQSLTSNQKLMLNQELASRADQTGSHDPMLNSLLANLNLIPNQTNMANVGGALSLLQNINKMNPIASNGLMASPASMLNPMNSGLLQPGLLGAAPGIPNIPQDFQMGFDPRNQNGLLGTGPNQFTNFDAVAAATGPSVGGFQNYQNDDFYPDNQGGGGGGNFRGNQGRNDNRSGNFNRDRRRGGRNNNFNRNQGGNRNQFRRNQGSGGGRSNRAHTPP